MGARVHLHIGLQKSGTTYLQHAWADRLDELAAAGLRYPVEPSGRNEVPNQQLAFYGLIPQEFSWLGERDYSSSWAWLQGELARTSSPLLLSAEALSTLRPPAAATVVEALGGDVGGPGHRTSPGPAARLLMAAERAERARRRVPRVPRVRARPSGPAAGRHRRRGAGPDLAVVLGRCADPAVVRPARGVTGHGRRQLRSPRGPAVAAHPRGPRPGTGRHRAPAGRVRPDQRGPALGRGRHPGRAEPRADRTGLGPQRGDRRPQGGDHARLRRPGEPRSRRHPPAGVAGRGRAVGQGGRARGRGVGCQGRWPAVRPAPGVRSCDGAGRRGPDHATTTARRLPPHSWGCCPSLRPRSSRACSSGR